VKRAFDLIVSFLLLVVLCIPIILVGFFVWLLLGSPAFFVQLRPGKNGKPFKLYKFRTMLILRDKNGELLSDGARLTRFGKFLRSTSLDELPELFNVLKGDMSLVGPRPLLMSYLDLYTPEQARRHEVLPGITGWAQVNGRNAINWEKKFEMDVWYVDNWSMGLDLKILLRTPGVVLKRRGIGEDGKETTPEFKGSEGVPLS
jgi:lipopolysaccharide/colanic/teichoic acid biosynthesis glycosyltransferase